MLIVKVGGDDGLDLGGIAQDIVAQQRPTVVIHGANQLRDRIAAALGTPPTVVESISGQSSVLSDEPAIDALLAAYAGIRNKRLVEALRRAGGDAIGLTGLDGGLVGGRVNRGIRVRRGDKKVLLRDLSGKPVSINRAFLGHLLATGMIPVLTVPICGEDGTALNSENDEILTELARALQPSDVVSLMGAPGLLADKDDPTSLVPQVHASELEDWEERVEGRMRRKIRALRRFFEAPGASNPAIRLADGRLPEPISRALAGGGTLVGGGPERPLAGVVELERPPPVRTGEDVPPPGFQPAPSTGDRSQDESRTPNGGGEPSHLVDVYGSRGLTLVRGAGATVWDDQGRAYIDCVGGHGSLALGHGHPALMAAFRAQGDLLWMAPGSFGNPARTSFVDALHDVLPPVLARTFLSNSGTESVEAAIKFARLHTGRAGLVAAEGGFHGRTLGALSVTGEQRYRSGFEPLLPGVRTVGFNDIEALREGIDDSVAAFIVEPVQGERGVYPATAEYIEAAREACDRAGALLIFDEVQTGFGRTGKLFAFEHFGVIPDVLCLSKSIASGLPLGATVVRRDIEIPIGAHGSTFGGNPVACAVAREGIAQLSDPSSSREPPSEDGPWPNAFGRRIRPWSRTSARSA